jgi:hypothetical protein
VSVGDSADTSSFAVEAMRRWWSEMGKSRLPDVTKLLITADGGGSNGHRLRPSKIELATPAAETGPRITATRYRRGTPKWNRIGHKMFSFTAMN